MAQHGGEIGEANDWCRLHGLALQPVFRSATPAVTCEPLTSTLAQGNDVFIFLYIHRLTRYTCAPSLVIKDANHFPGTSCFVRWSQGVVLFLDRSVVEFRNHCTVRSMGPTRTSVIDSREIARWDQRHRFQGNCSMHLPLSSNRTRFLARTVQSRSVRI